MCVSILIKFDQSFKLFEEVLSAIVVWHELIVTWHSDEFKRSITIRIIDVCTLEVRWLSDESWNMIYIHIYIYIYICMWDDYEYFHCHSLLLLPGGPSSNKNPENITPTPLYTFN